MAYSVNEILRRARQMQAYGGKRLSKHAISGAVRGALESQQERMYRGGELAMRKRALEEDIAYRKRQSDIQREQFGQQEERLEEAAEEAAKAEAMSGYLTGGALLLSTPTGKGAAVGAYEAIGSGIGAASEYGAAALGYGGAVGPSVTTTTVAEGGMWGAAAPTAAPTVATPTAGIGTAIGTAALAVGAGAAGSWLGKQKSFQEITPWSGEKTEKSVAGGVAAGLVVGGPVGGLIGGLIGGIIGGITGGK